jgi:hypothetical protein
MGFTGICGLLGWKFVPVVYNRNGKGIVTREFVTDADEGETKH